MMTPLLSVLMPAFNCEKYVGQAIESILNQTYDNFEFIIINDGSTDDTEKVILSFSDSRIRYIKNTYNLGLIETLNKGIQLSKGEFIARMDADDISYPERFRIQIEFLNNNSDYVICSSSRKNFIEWDQQKHLSIMPLDDISIRIGSLFSTPFTHPAVMLRKNIIIENELKFDNAFKYAEDYEFWINILKFGKGYNFKNPLIYYRDTPNS